MGGYDFGVGGPFFNGMPMLGGSGVEFTVGKTWYVGPNGSNANVGRSPTKAWSTLDYALSRVASTDVIYVMPSFTQNVIAAGTINMSTAGVKIIGLGEGAYRPTLNFTTAAAATFSVSAANCKIKNFYMDMTKVNGLTTPIVIGADSFWMDQCEAYFAKSGSVAGVVASTTATTLAKLKFTGNYFHGDAVASCTNAIQDLGGDSHIFQGNTIVGNFTANLGCINNVTPGLCTNILIDNNWLANRTAIATKVIVLYAGDTGFITNNRMAIASTGNGVTAAGCWFGGNYYASAAATAATLL